ncbi:multidrug MFS transporter [Streptococcus infantarius]|uniref:glycosyltransferase n=1 Tax=Streptococcus infantarius TaxID=102684 RepID=UPI00208E1EEA|nr:glycosyltransferase [Streptococcus infantarius]MCO4558245.1 Glycosyl transferase CpsG [Streptococcus infantarius subsp. infantarius]MCO4562531.1 Glycosyl transferase CpsG [Streptococcus infantarius subsp. infantarius]MCO4575576.1 Glycosyl transferase CpsG [Streptococcus infantarius subsp. infantarius]MCY7242906.1 multidrug MFS transporter [Streptococcus infantarius]
MIFVTVGTHEQPFNRLIQEVDHLVETGVIKDDVFIQTGYSTYEPKFCKWLSLISFDKMNELMETSDIIITHGGPATFMSAIANGKKPIVVPRQEKYDEHVNDHQVDFAQQVKERYNSIEVITEISELGNYLNQDLKIDGNESSNNKLFNDKLREEVEGMFEEYDS